MSLATAFYRLAKTQRGIANDYATELRTGMFPWRADHQRAEIVRLRAAAREHLEWARRERQGTHKMEAAE